MPWTVRFALLVLMLGFPLASNAGEWLQFRGVHGLAAGEAPLPSSIGPDQNVLWKVELPPGHSSPVIAGKRMFVTAVRDKQKLVTIALDTDKGTILWEKEAPHETLELIHSIGSHAQCTPVTDGERVVVFFGSSGLFCYDAKDGGLLWFKKMGPFKNDFGAGSSPLIVDDKVLLYQDHDVESFVIAYDKQSGSELWKTDRAEFPRNYGSPVIWEVAGTKQLVIAATLRVAGYDVNNGKELWTVRGIARFISATPVVGSDGILYVAGWAKGGDDGDRLSAEPFDVAQKNYDKNQNDAIERDELPKETDAAKQHPFDPRFVQVDRDKDGKITRAEWEGFRKMFDEGKNVVMAVKPGAVGDATKTHALWVQPRNVPFCSSPVYYKGLLFTVKDGGICTSLDSKTGKVLKEGRLSGTKNYYCSPLVGDGKLYVADEQGKLTVLKAQAEWETISKADFGENIYATPAIVDGRIYLRTVGHLYCFGLPN